MSYLISNRIKQPSQCCVNCGKSYKKRENLTKHLIICDFISKKKHLEEEDEIEIPSQRVMYQLLIELGQKYKKLEEQMDEMTKWVSKKKKKINVIEWLNSNIKSNKLFDSFMNVNLGFQDTDMEFVMSSSFYDTMNLVFSRTLFEMEEIPIFAFTQKVNVLYVYNDENIGWIELSREKMIKWFNKMHMQFAGAFYSWTKIKRTQMIENKDKFENACDKTNIKLMSVDFRVENMFSKMRGILFNGLKKDMKALVEYEFEF
jgi:hypothetical protein